MAETRQIKREIAYKVRIKDILDGRYVKEEGWKPNYILIEDGRQISRVNMIGVVVSKNIDNLNYNLLLDDGSGRISIRRFDNNPSLDDLDIGEVVLLVARPREYGNEKYLVLEIIKKIKDKKWIDVRKLELKRTVSSSQEAEGRETREEKGKEAEIVEEEIVIDERSLPQKVFALLRELDNGDGVEVEEIIKRVDSEDTEKIIDGLLREGEVFEVKPGRIKILE